MGGYVVVVSSVYAAVTSRCWSETEYRVTVDRPTDPRTALLNGNDFSRTIPENPPVKDVQIRLEQAISVTTWLVLLWKNKEIGFSF